ncbi:MAG: hypothetical protein GXP26_12005 [Planctomycetes bacterium]|nr:hypothetical protein [Planctomycetota bacterium]
MLQTLAILLTTSLVCVGLLAAWAATSPKHWFLRTGVFVAVLALLLLIPAYEPFVAFVLQGAVVAAGVQCTRWWRQRKEAEDRSSPRTQFSLATLLLVTVYVAIAAAVATRLPALNFRAWQSVVLIGAISGLATLLGLWIVHGRLVRWWLRVVVGFILALSISLPLVWGDWFVLSAVYYPWPPPAPGSVWSKGIYGGYSDSDPIAVWIPITISIIGIFCGIFLLLFRFVVTDPIATCMVPRLKRITTGYSLLLLASVLLIPPAFVYYQLMTPLPIPQTDLPDPNGYDALVVACKMAANSKFNNLMYDYYTTPTKELAATVKTMEWAYEQVQVGLAEDVQIPVDYKADTNAEIDTITSRRALARAIAGRGWLAQIEERFEDAVRNYLDVIKLGYALRRGGLIVDAHVGSAISGMGRYALFNQRNRISETTCTELVAALTELESQCENDDDFVLRNRIWRQHAKGWHGHFVDILGVAVYGDSFFNVEVFCNSTRRERAQIRLLRVELAIQAWRVTHGSFPESLSKMVPKYLAEIPVDPFDPEGGLLRYRQTDEGYLLYSVGYNGIDDDGVAPGEEDVLGTDTGDLRLDVLYATEPTEGDGGDDENETSEEDGERIESQ